MQPHNRLILHCLECGAVQHQEPAEKIPHCCGRQMVRAAEETVPEHACAQTPAPPRRAADGRGDRS